MSLIRNSVADRRIRLRSLSRVAVGLAVVWACASALPAPATAQYVPFGKNKVQYSEFDWQVLAGPHVDVYYYPEEEELARVALSYAEASFDTLTALFRHRPFRRVPVFIYSSHQHFEQTNLTQAFLPEGVAGFTEFLKRRIALPFNGSYYDFRHTIRHELVHFFQLSKLTRVFAQYPRFRGPALPLWWSEGIAERWSSDQDSEDHMFIRDLVLNGRLPTLMQFTYDRSFAAYPLGGQLHQYLGERFGYGRVADLYENLWKYDSFEEAFAAVYGVTLEKLDREWRYELEREYFPLYEERAPVAVDARPLLEDLLPNFKPVVYEGADGEPVLLFMSPRTGYTKIYRMPLFGGDDEVRGLVQGNRSAEFESLHFFSSRLDVSRDGKLAFVSKYLEKDAIHIYDVERRKVVGRYQFDELVSLTSPSWSPDGRKLVFTALHVSGPSDLYVLDFDTQEHYPITDDLFLENDPDWSPDGRYIVFSSDRTSTGFRGHENLFLYDVETAEVRYLTYGPWKDLDPRWSPDGRWVLFTSDRNSVYDLYLVDAEGRGGRLTDYTGAAFDPEWLPAGDAIVFSAFEKGTFNVYLKPLQVEDGELDARLVDRFGPPSQNLAQGWRWRELDEPVLADAESRPYSTHFGLDFAAGQAAFAPGFGSAQGAQFLMSDMLGNHLLYFAVVAQNFGGGIDDVFNSFAGQAIYLNLSRRVNWGVGAFRWKGRFVDQAFNNVFEEETFGGFFLASYPFSKFRRLEVQTVLEYSDRRDTNELFRFSGPIIDFPDTLSVTRRGVIATNRISYVKDNTLWLPTGPIDGVRWNVTAGVVSDLTKARAENYEVFFDYRRYVRTSLLSAYAVRAFGYWSDGAIPGRIAVGGPYTLRLYPFLGFIGSRVWMVNQEWRFPITHGIAFAFPFGTIRFPGIQGGLFVDMGQVWLEDRDPRGVWGSYGLGLRMPIIFPLVLRLDIGRRFKTGDLPSGKIQDFHGTEVDFFIGFNY